MTPYEEGRAFFLKHLGGVRYMNYREMVPYDRDSNKQEFDDFCRGMGDAQDEHLRETMGGNAFLRELDELCRKYGVRASSGCGCCDGGLLFPDGHGSFWSIGFDVDGLPSRQNSGE